MKAKQGKGDNDMNAIAKRITENPAANVAEMALRIKQEAPTLADLNNEQLEQIARLVITQGLADEMKAAVNIAGIDYNAEKETFLIRKKSEHTKRAYSAAMDELEKWAEKKNKSPLQLTAADADALIYDMKAQSKAPATIRRNVAAISAFYNFLTAETSRPFPLFIIFLKEARAAKLKTL